MESTCRVMEFSFPSRITWPCPPLVTSPIAHQAGPVTDTNTLYKEAEAAVGLCYLKNTITCISKPSKLITQVSLLLSSRFLGGRQWRSPNSPLRSPARQSQTRNRLSTGNISPTNHRQPCTARSKDANLLPAYPRFASVEACSSPPSTSTLHCEKELLMFFCSRWPKAVLIRLPQLLP